MKGEAFKLKLEYGHSDYIAVLIINHQQIAMLDFHFWSSQCKCILPHTSTSKDVVLCECSDDGVRALILRKPE